MLESPQGRIVAIEVKTASSVKMGDFRGLRAVAEEAGSRFVRGVVLYGGREVVPFGANLHALPHRAMWRM